jgi:hypothetical protein
MKITNMILFYAKLIIMISSILLSFGTYMYVIFKSKKIDAIFLFYQYATPKELKIMKIALIGYLVSVIIFIIS